MKTRAVNYKLWVKTVTSFILLFSYVCVFSSYAQQNYPRRIISLGPSLTKELYLLGAGDKLIACTIYAPAYAKNKRKVGTVINVNLEKTIELNPDLVLATSLTDPKEIKRLKQLGIRVVVFPQAKNFRNLCDQFLELANLIGKGRKAAGIVEKAKKEVEQIKIKAKNFKKSRVFIQVGANPLFTVTKHSFVNDFIEFAHSINIARDAGIGLYSREKVIEKNPDVIFIVTMGVGGAREKSVWQRYKEMNAVKNKRIYIIDSYKICSPTPVSFVNTLKEIAKILHPEIRGRI